MKDLKAGLILMADDDPDDRVLVKDALAECGAEPGLLNAMRFVGDGEELMDYLLRRGDYAEPDSCPRPDLILLDLNMPRKDGREALKEIRDDPDLRRIPIVVFTTSRADTDIRKVYELGANSFITKPAAFDALVTTVTKMVGYWFDLVELPSATLAAP